MIEKILYAQEEKIKIVFLQYFLVIKIIFCTFARKIE